VYKIALHLEAYFVVINLYCYLGVVNNIVQITFCQAVKQYSGKALLQPNKFKEKNLEYLVIKFIIVKYTISLHPCI